MAEPNNIISGVRPLSTQPASSKHEPDAERYVFISYSRKQKDYAQRLTNLLGERGFGYWIDWGEIAVGDQWMNKIEQGIIHCDAFILIMTSDSQNSEVVKKELQLARQHNKTILPLLLHGKLWDELASLHCIDVSKNIMPDISFFDQLGLFVPPKPPEKRKPIVFDPRNRRTVEDGAIPRSGWVGAVLIAVFATVGYGIYAPFAIGAISEMAGINGFFVLVSLPSLGIGALGFIGRAWKTWRLEQMNYKLIDGKVLSARLEGAKYSVDYCFVSPLSGREINGQTSREVDKKEAASLSLPPVGRPARILYGNDKVHKLL
jgi:hypothetical protein